MAQGWDFLTGLIVQGDHQLLRPYKQLSWVRRGVDAICDAVALLPGAVVDSDGRPIAHPIDRLFDSPNNYQSREQFLRSIIRLWYIDGGCFVLPVRAGTYASPGVEPDSLHVVRHKYFEAKRGANNLSLEAWKYKPGDKARVEELSPDQVMRFYFPSEESEFEPLSPLEAVQVIMDWDFAAQTFNWQFFKRGCFAGGKLKFEDAVDPEVRDALARQVEEKLGGAEKAGGVIRLPPDVDLEPWEISHKEMQFLEGRLAARDEILMALGVPKAVAGATEELNFATYLGQVKMFYENTVLPRLRSIENNIRKSFNLEYKFQLGDIEALQRAHTGQLEEARLMVDMGVPAYEALEKVGIDVERNSWLLTWWKPMGVEDVQAPVVEVPPAEGPPVDQEGDEDDVEDTEEDRSIPRRRYMTRAQAKEVRQRELENEWYEPSERKLRRAVVPYLKDLRDWQVKQVRDLLGSSGKSIKRDIGDGILFLPGEWDDILGKAMRPTYVSVASTMLSAVEEELGDLSFGVQDARIVRFLDDKILKVKTINKTLHEALRRQLQEGLAAAESVDDIAARIERVFNVSIQNAQRIARTEAGQTANGVRNVAFEAEGVTLKTWSTALDEKVRETHVILGALDPKQLKYDYSTDIGSSGRLLHPGDMQGSAKEVINCRCVMLAED